MKKLLLTALLLTNTAYAQELPLDDPFTYMESEGVRYARCGDNDAWSPVEGERTALEVDSCNGFLRGERQMFLCVDGKAELRNQVRRLKVQVRKLQRKAK
jgi:hypothetical protein